MYTSARRDGLELGSVGFELKYMKCVHMMIMSPLWVF
jgi:hypothetical protein